MISKINKNHQIELSLIIPAIVNLEVLKAKNEIITIRDL